ncbi:MAG: RNA polymerase sigma factor [Fimbriimonas sp.]|nr:RNA polymerase sigma factor [Fimbriimonas sp.]
MTREIVRELIQQSLRGDHIALERLLEAHRRIAFSLAIRALGNVDDAMDVVQESLAYASIQLPTLRDHDRFEAWLRQLTLSQCANLRRNRGTRRLGTSLSDCMEVAIRIDPSRHLDLRTSLGCLNEPIRTTFLLRFDGGWSIPEIASLLAIPENTVRSRLMAAKQRLRSLLEASNTTNTPMPLKTIKLNAAHAALLLSTFPESTILEVLDTPEPWQPFSPRVRLRQSDGTETAVDFRGDIGAKRLALLGALERLGIPGPRVRARSLEMPGLCLCEQARGENLTNWTMNGTAHRIRLATDRAIEAIDRLQGCADELLSDPVGAEIERRSLLDEVEILTTDDRWAQDPWLAEAGRDRRRWLADPWFRRCLGQVREAALQIDTLLVYTDYTFFFPGNYRIEPGNQLFDMPLGWPGDPVSHENPLVEFTSPFGHFGDPLLGLAMVWIYDCYPFVHTGFVEQVLWRRGVSRREFAPRIALKALQMVARDLPVERPPESRSFWDSLHGWVEQSLAWM